MPLPYWYVINNILGILVFTIFYTSLFFLAENLSKNDIVFWKWNVLSQILVSKNCLKTTKCFFGGGGEGVVTFMSIGYNFKSS